MSTERNGSGWPQDDGSAQSYHESLIEYSGSPEPGGTGDIYIKGTVVSRPGWPGDQNSGRPRELVARYRERPTAKLDRKARYGVACQNSPSACTEGSSPAICVNGHFYLSVPSTCAPLL